MNPIAADANKWKRDESRARHYRRQINNDSYFNRIRIVLGNARHAESCTESNRGFDE